MIDDTINDGKTIAGGGKDVVLAGRYHIIRQLGCDGRENGITRDRNGNNAMNEHETTSVRQ